MNRYRAAAFHLCISGLVGLAVFSAFWFVWYPSPLFAIMGGLHMYVVMLGVDIVTGPLLTLVVYRRGKPGLKLDLAVIAMLQIAALCYGVSVLWSGRPVFLAAVGDRFDVIAANEISERDLADSRWGLPFWGPQWVATTAPTDANLKERIAFGAMGGKDYGNYPQIYAPLDKNMESVIAQAKSIDVLKQFNPVSERPRIDQWLDAHGLNASSTRFLPLRAQSTDAAVIVDVSTRRIVDVVPFIPW